MANEQAESRRISVSDIQGQKGGRPIVCLTAYSKPMAQWLDPHVDLLLVGDSLAMVIYGMETTRGVTLDAMINHGMAVMRGSEHACVIVDLPHGTYEDSPDQALRSASRVMEETEGQGVKLEGGGELAADFVIHAGIQGGGEPVTGAGVRQALVSALRQISSWQLEQVAIPPIGVGPGNLTLEEAARIMLDVIVDHEREATYPTEVCIVVDTDEDKDTFDALQREME